MENIAIYGAGDFGQRMFEVLKRIGGKVVFFVQSSEVDIKERRGVPIISVEEYFRNNYDYIIFIAINNAAVVNEIYELFAQKNYDRNKIFDGRAFIEDNYGGNATVAGGDKVCNLCGNHFKEFLPAGTDTQLFFDLKVIGGGYRKNRDCPYCGSMDRNRWVYWVLREKTDIFKGGTVLHFAPEKMIRKKLECNEKCDYYAGDVVLKAGHHKIDVTKMQFRDDFFDYILINHVLEHVEDEAQAFCELRRVIKPKGKMILSFPVTMEIETVEREGIFSEEDRLKYYGQKDHVRLYGKDYKKRIEAYGWEVQQYIPECMMDTKQIEKYGFIKNDILLVCSKND